MFPEIEAVILQEKNSRIQQKNLLIIRSIWTNTHHEKRLQHLIPQKKNTGLWSFGV